MPGEVLVIRSCWNSRDSLLFLRQINQLSEERNSEWLQVTQVEGGWWRTTW
jgi:hypothetical protein